MLRPPTTWSVGGGALNITMMANRDFWGGQNNAPLFSIVAPTGDLEIQVKQAGALTLGGQTTGILAYQDDDNYVANYYEYLSGGCNCRGMELVREVGGSPTSTITAVSSNPMYVRLTKFGNDYTGGYSTNGGASFIQVGTYTTAIGLSRIGITAFSYTSNVTSVSFTNFRVRRYTTPEPSTSLGAQTSKY